MSVSTPTLITFLIYIAAMILIGFIAYRATKNFSDYILGGAASAASSPRCRRAPRT